MHHSAALVLNLLRPPRIESQRRALDAHTSIKMENRDALAHLDHTTTFFDGNYNAESVTVTICCALALCNAIELLVLIFTTFRRYAGLYFWSLVVASSGVVPYVIGFMFEYFRLVSQSTLR